MARHTPPRGRLATLRINTVAIFLLGVVCPSLAAEITNGPLAGQSIREEIAYQTARACAAKCLAYRGDLPCNVVGFYDLAAELGCDKCDTINGCYCAASLGSSATSYLSSCISAGCAKSVANWEGEVTSMLALYDGYCATANVAPSTTSKAGATKTTPSGTTNTGATNPGAGPDSGSATQTAAGSDTTTAPVSSGQQKSGLSQSDIVALAASLGVGIPSIAIAALTLWLQLKKRKNRRETVVLPGGGSKVSSTANIQYHAPPEQHQVQPHAQYGGLPYGQELGGQQVHELGEMRGH